MRCVGKPDRSGKQSLWWHVRHRLALPSSHFRRQVRLGRYIVDFANHRLEDRRRNRWRSTSEQIERDASRTKFLKSEGYSVLRFWNNEVLANIDGVLEMISECLPRHPHPHPSPQGGGDRASANPCPTSCSNFSPRKSPRACRRGRRRICARRHRPAGRGRARL